MKIEHIAIWVSDLESMKRFYMEYFGATPNELYHNTRTGFRSYFLSFGNSARLEIMSRADVTRSRENMPALGLAHLAISVGSKEKVVELTEKIRADGFTVLGEPRVTGDGYFESVIGDPEGNRIEITI